MPPLSLPRNDSHFFAASSREANRSRLLQKPAAHQPRGAPQAEMEQAHFQSGLKAYRLERRLMMRKEVEIRHVDIAHEPPACLAEVL